MAKNPYKKMQQRDFDLVKTLLEHKMPKIKISEITGRSQSTVDRIRNSATFEEYQVAVREDNKEYNQRRAAREATQQQVMEGVKEDFHEEIIAPKEESHDKRENDDLVRVLWAIHGQLKRLADSWENKPKGKSFFDKMTGNS